MVSQCHTCKKDLVEVLDLPEMRTQIGRGVWAPLCYECFLAGGGALCDECLWSVARHLVVDGVMYPTPMCPMHHLEHHQALDAAAAAREQIQDHWNAR